MKYSLVLFVILFFAVPTATSAAAWIHQQQTFLSLKHALRHVYNSTVCKGKLAKIDTPLALLYPKLRQYSEYSLSIRAPITNAAVRWDLPPCLLVAQSIIESDLNPMSISGAACVGLMQLNEDFLTERGNMGCKIDNRYSIFDSYYGGACLLSKLIRRYKGDIYAALLAYIAGAGSVDFLLKQYGNLKNAKKAFIRGGRKSMKTVGKVYVGKVSWAYPDKVLSLFMQE